MLKTSEGSVNLGSPDQYCIGANSRKQATQNPNYFDFFPNINRTTGGIINCENNLFVAVLADDPETQLRVIRETFVDTVLKGMTWIAALGLVSIYTRAYSTGWHLASTIQLIVAVSILLLFLSHKRLRYTFKVGAIFASFGIVGVSGLPTFGLAATSVSWLLLGCILANVIFSRNIGIAATALTMFVLTVAAFGFVSGRLTSPIDFQIHLTSSASWAGMILVNCGGVFVIMLAMGTYNRSVLTLLQEVKDQNDLIKDQRNQIAHLANHDALTGLPSLRLARDRLAMACSQAGRGDTKAAILFIDLDGFKAVNDTFDHAAGDHVLKIVASRLTEFIRSIDTAARYGGDEFLVILNGVASGEAACMVAKKIVAAIAEPIFYAGQQIKIGASIGIAVYPDHAGSAEELLKAADQAMYLVKKSGKNDFEVFRGYRRSEKQQNGALQTMAL